MGNIYDFLKEWEIATEADDITSEIDSATSDTVGDKKEKSSNSGDIDLNTEDILGSKDKSVDGDPTNPEKVNSDESTDDTNQEEPPTDGENEDTDMATDENSNEDDSSSENNNPFEGKEDDDNEFESIRKKKLHTQLFNFYKVLDSDVKLLSEYVPKISDEETITTLYNINSNLTQAKDYIYRILTEEFNSMEYPVLLKKYVALNRVYELSIKILEKYFEISSKDKKLTHDKKNNKTRV